jgi:hypothetical protein
MEKIALVERRKAVERDPYKLPRFVTAVILLVVGYFPYKLLNRDVAVP